MATNYSGSDSSTATTTSAANLSTINLSKLDFNDIKTSLKTYLQSQSLFTDYDFEGSALSILLDVLSYNTLYYSFYVNMIANEMFLDTASKADNAASIAKMLGYVPKSKRCATSTLELGNSGGSDVFIDVGDLVATTTNTYWYHWNGTGITLGSGATANVAMYGSKQGGAIASPIVDSLVIPDTDVDTTTLKVYVEENGVNKEYARSSNIVSGLSGDDSIYFLDTVYDGYYKIKFGDGVFGKSVPDTSTTRIQYIRGGNGPSDNGINTFTLSAQLGLNLREVVTSSRGGANPDSLQDIKFNAPAYFQSQNRAVTKNDFKSIATQELRSVSSMSIWGGEESNPPKYGRVFISTTSDSEIDIDEIVTILKNKSVISILPEYVAPITTVVFFNDFVVEYDKFSTNKSSEELLTLVKSYMQTNHRFGLLGSGLKFENINSAISDLDVGIVGIRYFLTLAQTKTEVSPSASYLFDFGQAAIEVGQQKNSTGNVIYSSLFSHAEYPEDGSTFYIKNGSDGQIDLYHYVDGGDDDLLISDGVGTYNEEKGFVYLRDVPSTIAFTLYYEPRSLNIVSKRNIMFSRYSDWPSDDNPIIMEEI